MYLIDDNKTKIENCPVAEDFIMDDDDSDLSSDEFSEEEIENSDSNLTGMIGMKRSKKVENQKKIKKKKKY